MYVSFSLFAMFDYRASFHQNSPLDSILKAYNSIVLGHFLRILAFALCAATLSNKPLHDNPALPLVQV